MVMTFHDIKTMDKQSEQMVLEVVDGNPGACAIVCLMLSSPLWYPILQALIAQNLVGSELWRVVHDDYDGDWNKFVHSLLNVNDN